MREAECLEDEIGDILNVLEDSGRAGAEGEGEGKIGHVLAHPALFGVSAETGKTVGGDSVASCTG